MKRPPPQGLYHLLDVMEKAKNPSVCSGQGNSFHAFKNINALTPLSSVCDTVKEVSPSYDPSCDFKITTSLLLNLRTRYGTFAVALSDHALAMAFGTNCMHSCTKHRPGRVISVPDTDLCSCLYPTC